MAGSGVALRLHEFRESQDSSGPNMSIFLHESRQSPNPRCEDYQQSFDVRTLRALTVLHHSPAVWEQRPPQTAYQEQFGLQSPIFPQ
eukprot:superscaffoldBa00004168_g18388